MPSRKLNRLNGFDYALQRLYFITICVHNHSCDFGRIEKGEMIPSLNGLIASEQWEWLGKQFEYLDLISFVVMPDHVHGIIRINVPEILSNQKIKPLPELLGAYKTTVSKRIHASGDIYFKWQKSYHDHIIRNNVELSRIMNYIENNPINWRV